MKVYCYLSDQWACGHYRQVFPSQAIDEPGVEIEIISADTRTVQLDINQRGQLIREGFPRDADVVVLQRPTNLALVQSVPMLQARGVAVVVDIDDDLAAINPNNPAWAAFHPATTTVPGLPVMHSWNNLAFACRHATLVTVTTDALVNRYGSHGRVRILPNCVPQDYLDIPHVDSPTLGWAGSIHSHPHDLQAVGVSIARLVREGARFEQVGNPMGVAAALGLPDDPIATGDLDFSEWHLAVASRIGIGIVPLAADRFNRSKSWLKGLEYAAVGVPFVASDLPAYRALQAEGAGLLADHPKRWYRHLRSLIDDEARRRELAEAGRAVAQRWVYETNGWRWAEAWSDAVRMVHGQRVRYTNPKPVGRPRPAAKPAQTGRKARRRRVSGGVWSE